MSAASEGWATLCFACEATAGTGINMFRAKSERLLEAPERKNIERRATTDITTLRRRPGAELLAGSGGDAMKTALPETRLSA